MIKLTKEEEERAREIHARSIVINGLNVSKIDDDYFPKMRDGGVTGDHITVSFNRRNLSEVVKDLSRWYSLVERNSKKILWASGTEDVRRAKETGKTAIIPGLQDTVTLEGDVDILRIYHKLGIRVIQLTYNDRNLVGDGCGERTNTGLSNLGFRVIKEMNRLGILVDLSHVGDATTSETIEVSKQPVAFTHANARTLCDNMRNKTDEQIKAIAEKGGVMGICAYSPMLSREPNPTIDVFLDQLDYVVNLAGVDGVGIGLDLIEGWTKRELVLTKKWPHLYPSVSLVSELNSISKIHNITRGLVSRSYSDREIKKILGGNFVRLMERVWR